jgi:hypothetical protein
VDLAVIDPRHRALPFGMVQVDWLDRLLAIPGHRPHLKVAAAVASRVGRRDGCTAPLSLAHLREVCALDRTALWKALQTLQSAAVVYTERAGDDSRSWSRYSLSPPSKVRPAGARAVRPARRGREAKLFRAHTDADWFRSATPACVRAYLAHARFSGPQKHADGWGHCHFAGRTKLVATSGLSRRALQKWTRCLEGKAFEIHPSTGRQTLTYWWLFPVVPSPQERLLVRVRELCHVLPPVSPPRGGGASFWVSSRSHRPARESTVAEVVRMLIDEPTQRIAVWRHESEGWVGALDIPEVVHGTRFTLETNLDLNPNG